MQTNGPQLWISAENVTINSLMMRRATRRPKKINCKDKKSAKKKKEKTNWKKSNNDDGQIVIEGGPQAPQSTQN